MLEIPNQHGLVTLSRDFYLGNGVLYYKSNFNGSPQDVLVLPKSLWFDVLESIHEHKEGLVHLGYAKCLEVMTARFYFQGMAKFIRQYIASFTVC